MKKKVLIVFGTRPEAIKMAPIVKSFKQEANLFETIVCVTAQHRQMLDQVLDFFEIRPDYDLDLMKPNQSLTSITSDIVYGLKSILENVKPDYVFVHGDTTTSFAAALAAFYNHSKVCHIEAGLRTHNKLSPYPEEMNRQLTARLADFHFAPTKSSETNLLKENIIPENILVTGNTVIDALLYSSKKVENYRSDEIRSLENLVKTNKRILLVTGHRRENHGEGFQRICTALKTLAASINDIEIIYPVHLNPNVVGPVFNILSGIANVHLIEPLSYPTFVWLMSKSYVILTDSGGVQEEAPSLGKPVLVMRDTTERPEAVKAGTVILVGTNYDSIVSKTEELFNDRSYYDKMAKSHNPYGDGNAASRVVNYIKNLNF